jgi:hypothetical protein
MSKSINLNPFKNVAVALIVLLSGSVTWGQNVPPRIDWLTVPTKWISGGVTYSHDADVECQVYVPNETTPWNGLNTVKGGIPIENLVLPAFTIPTSKINPGSWPHTFGISAVFVDGYWDEIYKESEGWVKYHPASTGFNCHGHSTRPFGEAYSTLRFIDGTLFGDKGVLKIDYDERNKAKDITTGAVFGNDAHTIRVDGVIHRDASGGGKEHTIFITSEKFGVSAVYKRELELKDRVYYPDNAEIPNPKTPELEPMNPFWIRKP